jgi:hypothetical protein
VKFTTEGEIDKLLLEMECKKRVLTREREGEIIARTPTIGGSAIKSISVLLRPCPLITQVITFLRIIYRVVGICRANG